MQGGLYRLGGDCRCCGLCDAADSEMDREASQARQFGLYARPRRADAARTACRMIYARLRENQTRPCMALR